MKSEAINNSKGISLDNLDLPPELILVVDLSLVILRSNHIIIIQKYTGTGTFKKINTTKFWLIDG